MRHLALGLRGHGHEPIHELPLRQGRHVDDADILREKFAELGLVELMQ